MKALYCYIRMKRLESSTFIERADKQLRFAARQKLNAFRQTYLALKNRLPGKPDQQSADAWKSLMEDGKTVFKQVTNVPTLSGQKFEAIEIAPNVLLTEDGSVYNQTSPSVQDDIELRQKLEELTKVMITEI